MKIAKFKNAPRVEDDGTNDDDIYTWLDDREAVEEIEAALRNAAADGIMAHSTLVKGFREDVDCAEVEL